MGTLRYKLKFLELLKLWLLSQISGFLKINLCSTDWKSTKLLKSMAVFLTYGEGCNGIIDHGIL